MAKTAAIVAATEALRSASVLEDLVGYHLRRASLADMSGVTGVLADLDARPVPFSVLTLIVENPGITSAEICRQLMIQRANIVPILAELDAQSFFVRNADPRDQRIQRLYATEIGSRAQADWLARVRTHEERLLQNLTSSERDTLRQLLEKVWQGN
ncbi:MarR family winged helix-turn-helix transcriptional regulator [Rhizobiaceae sp. 2RAB30]